MVIFHLMDKTAQKHMKHDHAGFTRDLTVILPQRCLELLPLSHLLRVCGYGAFHTLDSTVLTWIIIKHRAKIFTLKC